MTIAERNRRADAVMASRRRHRERHTVRDVYHMTHRERLLFFGACSWGTCLNLPSKGSERCWRHGANRRNARAESGAAAMTPS